MVQLLQIWLTGVSVLKKATKSDPEMLKGIIDSDWEFDQECFTQWKEQCNLEFVVSDNLYQPS